MSFFDYMSTALYDPTEGYYAKGIRQVGKGGDFFTSVSVGPVFGHLLARRFLAEWQDLGQPSRWRITECGAHDGALANDILTSLGTLEPAALGGLNYAIIEPLDSLRDAQQETLKHHQHLVSHCAEAHELAPLPGVVFGNELLDALPFHLVECQQETWQECRVAVSEDSELRWETHAIQDPELAAAMKRIGHSFPDGYRSEVRTGFSSFLKPLARMLSTGSMIWIDYGFPRDDYYHPARHTGTLRTFDRHQAGENPLERPGETDITAHVDFTTLAEAVAALGGHTTRFESQGTWLTGLARDWLLSQEGQPQANLFRQFQTLTHPAQLGRSFQVMESSWGKSKG